MFDYRLENWNPSEAVGASRFGETCMVRVLSCTRLYGDRQTASTLLHEIMHAAAAVWSIGCDKEDGTLSEEQFVRPMSLGLATVWRDNPAVFEWIAKHLTAP